LGIAQPGARFEHADPRSGKKPHLGGELSGLLAAVVEVGGKLMVEEQNGFADGEAVFCAAEAEPIHAVFPSHLGGRDAQAGAGVGETGAVHMQRKAVPAAGLRYGAEFVDRVHGAHLSGLRDGDDAWLGIVDVLALGGQFADGLGSDLAVDRLRDKKLGTVGEKLRSATLVRLNVRSVRADYAVIALAERG